MVKWRAYKVQSASLIPVYAKSFIQSFNSKYPKPKLSLQSILFPTKIKNIDDTFLAGMGRFWNAGCDMKLVELTGTALSMGGRGTRGRGGPPIV